MGRFVKISSAVFLTLFFAASLGVPILYLVKEAFFIDGRFSLGHLQVLLSDTVLIRAFLNSFFIAFWCCVVSVLLALFLANISLRRTIPFRSIFDICVLAPLFLPPMVGVLGFKIFLSRSGVVNLLLMQSGITHAPVDIVSPGSPLGVILVQALHFYPLVYLQLVSYLSRFNAEYEEAAMSVGAQPWRWFSRITIPLMTPALMSSGLLVFIGSFTDIGTPLLFEYRNTVAVQVFNMLTDTANSGSGYALVFFVGCLSLVLFALSQWFERDAHVSAVGKTTKQLEKRPVAGLLEVVLVTGALLVGIISVFPHIGIFLQAVSKRWFMTVVPESLTAAHFLEVFTHPVAGWSLLYSVMLSVLSTFLVTALGFLIAWGAVRRRSPTDRVFELLSMVPLSLPGIVIAFGLMLGFSGTPLDNRHNPTSLLILAYTIRKLPFMVRILSASLRQANVSLEEAALMCGASRFQTIRRVTLPLLLPSCFAGGILCFIGSLLEVSDSLLLAMEEKYYPVAKALYALLGRPDGTPVASALSIVVMLIVIIGFAAAAKLSGRKVSQILVQ